MVAPRWTDDDQEELMTMLKTGVAISKIAAALGRTEKAVRGRIKFTGLRMNGTYCDL